MNVISSIYFKDFARYFQFLESSFEKYFSESVKFTHVSMYPCASRYLKVNKSNYISAFNFRSCEQGLYRIDADYDLAVRLASFNIKAMEMYGRNEKDSLLDRAISYLNFFDRVFLDEKFNLLISSGDSRLLPQVLIFLAKKYNVPIVYFEQGPYGTTTFDDKGVNANSSFETTLYRLSEVQEKRLHARIQRYKEGSTTNYWKTVNRPIGDRLFEWLTLLYLYPPIPLRKVLPKDLQEGLSFTGFLRSFLMWPNKNTIKDISALDKLPEKFILLVLQVPVDAQMIEHSPNFVSFSLMISKIFESMPTGYELIVREHPQYKGRYSSDVYTYMRENEISTANAVNLKELLKKSSVVIVNNSTVGIEAILEGKKVVALGNSIYSHRGITFDFDPDVSIGHLIDEALCAKFDQQKADSFLYHLLCCYLFDGHFQDKDLRLDEEKFFSLIEKNLKTGGS